MNLSNYRTLNIFIVSFLLSLLAISVAEANTVVRSGETVSITEDQTVEGDFYGAAGTISLSGQVTEDAVLMGGQITINGQVDANALVVGGGADVHGEIGDDLRIVAGDVKVADVVKGDLAVVGGSVEILPTAVIEGDLLVYAGDAVIAGKIGGDILGNIGTVRIDSEVGGKVEVTTNELTLGSKAEIQGMVYYTSANKAIQAQEATVVGDLVRSDPIIPQSSEYSWSWVIPGLMLLFSSLVWFLVSRKTLNVVVDRSVEGILKHSLVGFVFLLMVPVAVGMLLASMIGLMVALPLLFGYLLFLTLAIIGLVPVIGRYMMVAFSKPESVVTLLSLFVGAVGFGLLSMIPVIGALALMFIMLIVIGTLIDALILRVEYK